VTGVAVPAEVLVDPDDVDELGREVSIDSLVKKKASRGCVLDTTLSIMR
jgi:hypothetical protein